MVPFVNRALEWGAVVATFLSVLSVVPRHCPRLTCFRYPKRGETNAVLIPLKANAPSPAAPAAGPRRAVGAPHGNGDAPVRQYPERHKRVSSFSRRSSACRAPAPARQCRSCPPPHSRCPRPPLCRVQRARTAPPPRPARPPCGHPGPPVCRTGPRTSTRPVTWRTRTGTRTGTRPGGCRRRWRTACAWAPAIWRT